MKPLVENMDTFQIKNQTNGFIYKNEQLKEVARFTAKPMEVWILDVKKIHSVESTKEHIKRKAVTLGTRVHDYEAVCNMIKENGYECNS
jgi:hypothetical protein